MYLNLPIAQPVVAVSSIVVGHLLGFAVTGGARWVKSRRDQITLRDFAQRVANRTATEMAENPALTIPDAIEAALKGLTGA